MIFLKWLHDNCHIKKLTTAYEYKRVYFMLYRRCVGHSLHAKIAQDIDDVRVVPFCFVTERRRLTRQQYVNKDLRRMYNLDTPVAEKPVMNVDDVPSVSPAPEAGLRLPALPSAGCPADELSTLSPIPPGAAESTRPVQPTAP